MTGVENSIRLGIAQAYLDKLLKAGVISHNAYALAEKMCRERILAA